MKQREFIGCVHVSKKMAKTAEKHPWLDSAIAYTAAADSAADVAAMVTTHDDKMVLIFG